jgi:hypothetical protein
MGRERERERERELRKVKQSSGFYANLVLLLHSTGLVFKISLSVEKIIKVI